MRNYRFLISALWVFLLVFSAFTAPGHGTCPEDPNDQGECDSMYVEPWPFDTLQSGEEPHLVRVPIFVTADLADHRDSIFGFIIPLCYNHTNPSVYCSLSPYWNTPSLIDLDPAAERSVFRHLPSMSDPQVRNRMMDLNSDYQSGWDFAMLDLNGTSEFYFAAVATGIPDQGWWEGSRVLLATMTFRVEDDTRICLDTCFWPPNSRLCYAVRDSLGGYVTKIPRPGTGTSSFETCFNVRIGESVDVTPGPGKVTVPSSDVPVDFYVHSFTYDTDTFDVYLYERLGWNVEPDHVELVLEPDETDTVQCVLSVPEVPPGTTDSVYATAVCRADAAIQDSASLGVEVHSPPQVAWTSPAQNQLDVSISTDISVAFNEDMDETTLNETTFVVNARSTGLHPGMITYDAPTMTATLNPWADFAEGEPVNLTLTRGIRSSVGIPLASSYSWSFTSEVRDGMGVFSVDSVYAVEGHPSFISAADLDGDGDLDLATANESFDEVGVLLNQGNGKFALDSTYHVYDGPQCVFAADLDADSDMDLATANTWSSNVGVFLNNGDGTFTSVALYPVGTNPKWIWGADLDADGSVDLITPCGFSDNISILFNNGDGTFAPQSVYPVIDWPHAVVAADLDGDADLDLAISNTSSNNVWVMFNDGDGIFAPDSAYPVGSGPVCVLAADLDADGDVDLATTDAFNDNVSVLLNNGDGTFAPRSVYPVGDEPRSVSVADVDGDGDLDLVVANHQSNDISVLLNNGDGTFAPQSLHSAVAEPYCLFVADLNGDGNLDVATANRYWDSVSILFNRLRGDCNGDGVIDLGDAIYLLNYLFKNDDPPDPLEAGDANCDGSVEIGDAIYLLNYLFKNGPPPGC